MEAIKQTLQEAIDYINECRKFIAVGLLNIDRSSRVVTDFGYSEKLMLIERIRDFLQRAQSEYEEQDFHVFHLSGDEFLLVATEQNNSSFNTFDALRARISQRVFIIESKEIHVSVSIGMSHRNTNEAADELIQQAQSALIKAKKERNHTAIYSATASSSRTFSSADLHQVLMEPSTLNGGSGIVPHYQPIMLLENGIWQLAGFEVLLRIKRKNGETIYPPQIFEVAADSGKMFDVEKSVIAAALHHFSEIPHPHNLTLSLNLSPIHFQKPEKIIEILQLAHKYNVPHEKLRIEILEEDLKLSSEVSEALEICRRQGISLLIDDFGIKSSFRNSSKFKPDGLKIDREILPTSRDDDSRHVFIKLVEVGLEMGISVIVEGIETIEQRDFVQELHQAFTLKKNNITLYGQGFHFARPFSPDKLTGYIATQTQT